MTSKDKPQEQKESSEPDGNHPLLQSLSPNIRRLAHPVKCVRFQRCCDEQIPSRKLPFRTSASTVAGPPHSPRLYWNLSRSVVRFCSLLRLRISFRCLEALGLQLSRGRQRKEGSKTVQFWKGESARSVLFPDRREYQARNAEVPKEYPACRKLVSGQAWVQFFQPKYTPARKITTACASHGRPGWGRWKKARQKEAR